MKESESYSAWKDAFQQATEIQFLRSKLSKKSQIIEQMNDEMDMLERRQNDDVELLKYELARLNIENLKLKKNVEER